VEGRARAFVRSFAVYADRRMLAILAMGFASGLPLLLSTSTLGWWLSRRGVDRTAIGIFALVGLPYSLKFLWAPVIDHARLPWLSDRLGRRRGWMLAIQCALLVAIAALGLTDPVAAPLVTAVCALAVAFLSASQDIAIDAYRIEILGEREQGAGAAATQVGYRLALITAGGGAIASSDFVEWRWIFAGLAALVAVGIATTLLSREPVAPPRAPFRGARDILGRSVVEPFVDFLTRPGAPAILAFALLYKYGDAIGGVMAFPFYNELGFTGVELAPMSQVLAPIATVAGVVAGGALVARIGILRALVVGGILQAVTNLLYALLARLGPEVPMLALAVGVDNVANGVGSAAFVAYFSSLCSPRYTGTQYALLTSLMAAGRTALSAPSGALASALGWPLFFAATTLLALPGLALLAWLIWLDRRQTSSVAHAHQ
jgi:PAT family beta-lactamase induction signal transducer AmpG